MQRGSLMRVSRKQGPDVWQFRWSERDLNGRRVYRKKVLGSVGRYADEAAAPHTLGRLTASVDSYLAVGLGERLSSHLFMLDRAESTLRPKKTNKQG